MCLLAFTLISMAYASASVVIEDILKLGLPVVDVITVDGQEPTCDYIDHPVGSWGQSIINAVKVPGSVTVYDADGSIMYASGEYEKGVSGMTIKIRGNTSAYKEKKPFKIKLQKKGDLLARGDKYGDKNWVLVQDHMMMIWMGFEVSKAIGQEWTPACRYVNVVLNGDYRGMYLLSESVERNTKCRINVSDSGFIAEHDPYWWNEDGEYLPSVDNPQYNYTLKYPDFNDVGDGVRGFIADELARFEASVADGSYPEIIDVDSFARWLIAHDLMGTSDGGGVGLFYTKYDSSPQTPLLAGPLWDFDSAEDTPGKWSGAHGTRFTKLLSNRNETFKNRYIEIWKECGADICSSIDASIASLSDESWSGYDASIKPDRERWGTDYQYYRATSVVKNRLTSWYKSRSEWMSNMMETLDIAEMDGIDADCIWRHSLSGLRLTVESFGASVTVYSIFGTPIANVKRGENTTVSLPQSGMYIMAGGGKVIKLMAK